MLADAMRELHSSCITTCAPGSLGYSIRRILTNHNVVAMDIWEIHKAEWTRGAIVPLELPSSDTNTSICDCKIVVQVLAAYLFTLFIVIYMCCIELIAPYFETEAGQQLVREMRKVLLLLGLGYCLATLTIHTISVSLVPLVQLCRASSGTPIVRSLHPTERLPNVQNVHACRFRNAVEVPSSACRRQVQHAPHIYC
eukprot:4267715-Pyramimonas_sp.AAC.1